MFNNKIKMGLLSALLKTFTAYIIYGKTEEYLSLLTNNPFSVYVLFLIIDIASSGGIYTTSVIFSLIKIIAIFFSVKYLKVYIRPFLDLTYITKLTDDQFTKYITFLTYGFLELVF